MVEKMARLRFVSGLCLALLSAGCASTVPPEARSSASSSPLDRGGEQVPIDRPAVGLPERDAWVLAAGEWGRQNIPGFPEPESLSDEELRRVREGWTVCRALSFKLDGRHYAGGVAYQIVRSSPEDVLGALLDPRHLTRALPLTLDAQPLEGPGTGKLSVELLQGKAPVLARYTMRLSRPHDHALRFALDKNRPHGIEDVRGYLTAQPFGDNHTLVTVAVGFDLGRPWMRALLDGPVQKAALAAPAHLRRYLESRG